MREKALIFRLLFVGMFFCMLGCGVEESTSKALPSRAPHPIHIEEGEDDGDESYSELATYSEGEKLTLSSYPPVESMDVITTLKMKCHPEKQKEYLCSWQMNPNDKDLNFISFKEGEVQFLKSGDYLTKIKRERVKALDKMETIKRFHVDSPNKAYPESSLKNFKLYRNTDHLYSMVSRFELRGISDGDLDEDSLSSLKVAWEVRGGRYDILDEALPYLSKLHPFERTILFKERQKFEVKARVFDHKKEISEESAIIDLRSVDSSEVPVTVSLEAERNHIPVEQELVLKKEIQGDHKDYHFEWEVRKLKSIECPEEVLIFEDKESLPVRLAIGQICEQNYEEIVEADVDYRMGRTVSNEPFILFMIPGEYSIRLKVFNEDGILLGEDTRKVRVDRRFLTRAQ